MQSQSSIVPAEDALEALASHARYAIRHRKAWQNFILAIMAGAFIGAGAYFSILLASGIEAHGVFLLLLGLGFSAGFFFVILSGAVLFTEVNVLVPARVLGMTSTSLCAQVALFWALAAVGNVIGSLLFAFLLSSSSPILGTELEVLTDVADKKMKVGEGDWGWARVLVSGALANWLVGMAAFFAVIGRTIVDKYIPVFLAVSLFVAANLQHSPANVGYFALLMAADAGPGWPAAIANNLLPAAVGNILGAILFVAVPFHFAFARSGSGDGTDDQGPG